MRSSEAIHRPAFRGTRRLPCTLLVAAAVALGGCGSVGPGKHSTLETVDRQLDAAVTNRQPAREPDAVAQALLPPVVVEMPRPEGGTVEPRFDLNVADAPASKVLMAIVQGTHYSMIVHPAIKDNITLSLKNVTVKEALETVRDLYGYDFRVQGTRIIVEPPAIQTHVFHVNYLMSERQGRSDVRVTSGAISDFVAPGAGMPGTGIPGMSGGTPTPGIPSRPGAVPGGGGAGSQAVIGSRVVTTTDSDFWRELNDALKTIVGTEGGRNVVVSPQSGVIVVRAMPAEIRAVDSYLRATRLVIERQVMLEAKIIEVELSDGYQTGINWAAFHDHARLAGGVLSPGASLGIQGTISAPTARAADGSVSSDSALTTNPSSPGTLSAGVGVPGTVFGLALQTGNFSSLLSFLQTQGKLQVLSSPRIAALNNQKAVLKVGNDEFFVTNVTTTTLTNAAGGTTQSPSIVVQPFFSGVALDVTPQIDENREIILHVHPSVSNVVEKTKNIDLGTSGNFRLPLASSTISETDTVVRVSDGNIVAIGGLMRESTKQSRSGVPGLADVPIIGAAFRSTSRETRKSELVILIKPTVIQGDEGVVDDLKKIRARLRSYDATDTSTDGEPPSGGDTP
ncbi:MAG: pilus (MSHA type) biogenesis protein MshL [Betaproteobacteria bacterium]|nr:pilus (MSHA type) biogenesis protein MshL [Betaproteobacteria bacterium]